MFKKPLLTGGDSIENRRKKGEQAYGTGDSKGYKRTEVF
jgi:hypothetical protein